VFLVARAPLNASGEAGPARLGLVVTKKLGSAVDRNRVKRVCRECFRLWPDFVAAGVDLIVIARQGAPALGLAAVREEWSRAQGALRHRVREVLARPAVATHVGPHPSAQTSRPTKPAPPATAADPPAPPTHDR
jgi:ribonuclease P protein component